MAASGLFLLRLGERFDHDEFVPAVVDDLHGDLLLVTGRKGFARGSGKVLPDGVLIDALESPLEVVPGARAWRRVSR